jgi:hypothetical protein
MKKSILVLSILVLSLNYCNAQFKLPEGTTWVTAKDDATLDELYGQWVKFDGGYVQFLKMSPVNLQKAIKLFKSVLIANGLEGNDYKDLSIWPSGMDKTDVYQMHTNIIIEYGELSWMAISGDYYVGLSSASNRKSVCVMISQKK